jgi:hypothetical protein
MHVCRRCHTWREDRFHILRGILFASDDGKWTDFRHMMSMSGAPGEIRKPSAKICRHKIVVRRDWNFAEVEFGDHGSVMVRPGCHLGSFGEFPKLFQLKHQRPFPNALASLYNFDFPAPSDMRYPNREENDRPGTIAIFPSHKFMSQPSCNVSFAERAPRTAQNSWRIMPPKIPIAKGTCTTRMPR